MAARLHGAQLGARAACRLTPVPAPAPSLARSSSNDARRLRLPAEASLPLSHGPQCSSGQYTLIAPALAQTPEPPEPESGCTPEHMCHNRRHRGGERRGRRMPRSAVAARGAPMQRWRGGQRPVRPARRPALQRRAEARRRRAGRRGARWRSRGQLSACRAAAARRVLAWWPRRWRARGSALATWAGRVRRARASWRPWLRRRARGAPLSCWARRSGELAILRLHPRIARFAVDFAVAG